MFLELTIDPSGPSQGRQLLLHPPHYSPQTHLTAAGSSLRLPQPPPSAMPREPLFLAHCSLVPLQLATSSGSPSWLVEQAAGVRVLGSQHPRLFLGPLSQCLTFLARRCLKGQTFPDQIQGRGEWDTPRNQPLFPIPLSSPTTLDASHL